MSIRSQNPALYEINTWVWLAEVSQKYGQPIDLGTVPAAEWDAISAWGFDAVWFMGVWERSPMSIAISNRNENLLNEFRRALPDFKPEDNVGSPYSVRRYVVDKHLGGSKGLARARKELAQRSLGLLLDFVPNHIALDHPWVREHPEHLIRGNLDDVRNDPISYTAVEGRVFGCGRDPYFPAWQDVLQVNAFQSGLREAARIIVSEIAEQCDGIRCDMAMLLLNEIFERTWGSRAGPQPATEYWVDVIAAVKKSHPDFRFIAEAYWDLEWQLQQKGFDFCYDKRLYDRLEHGNADSVRLHLCADFPYQEKLLRFLENHDEPRAAAAFSPEKERAAAVTIYTLPGARLFHEGQLEGRKVRLPVFLGRRPAEPVDEDLQAFYRKLLKAIDASVFRDGRWNLCECSGWPDNSSFQNVVAWCWLKSDERNLVIVNLSGRAVQARVKVPWEDLPGETWRLTDAISNASYDRDGQEMLSAGLYVHLRPWNCHVFEFHRPGKEQRAPVSGDSSRPRTFVVK